MSKKAVCLTVVGAVFLLFIAIGIIIALQSDRGKKSSSRTSAAIIDLEASVRFDGIQFVLQNKNSFDWTNIKLEVNRGLFAGGYALKVRHMEAGYIYTLEASQFAKSDGTHLNPFTVKPQKFSIWCDVPRGKGFWQVRGREKMALEGEQK